MRVRYKIVKIDEGQKDFMKKYKVCACTYCDYSEGIFCTFRGKKCPAGKDEYLQKIYKFKISKDMRYKIVKMKKEEINNFHSCDLCECAHGNCVQNGVKLYNGFCDYPGECPAKENEFIKKVNK